MSIQFTVRPNFQKSIGLINRAFIKETLSSFNSKKEEYPGHPLAHTLNELKIKKEDIATKLGCLLNFK